MIELLGVPGGKRCLWDVSELSIVSIPLAWGMFVYSEVLQSITSLETHTIEPNTEDPLANPTTLPRENRRQTD